MINKVTKPIIQLIFLLLLIITFNTVSISGVNAEEGNQGSPNNLTPNNGVITLKESIELDYPWIINPSSELSTNLEKSNQSYYVTEGVTKLDLNGNSITLASGFDSAAIQQVFATLSAGIVVNGENRVEITNSGSNGSINNGSENVAYTILCANTTKNTGSNNPTLNINNITIENKSAACTIAGQDGIGIALGLAGPWDTNVTNCTLTGQSGLWIANQIAIGDQALIGNNAGSTSNLEIHGTTKISTGKTNTTAEAALSTYGISEGNCEINIGGNPGDNIQITGSGNNSNAAAGIYAPNPNSTITIGTGTTVSGYSGIVLRGGSINLEGTPTIEGTGKYSEPDEFPLNSSAGTGSGIYVMPASNNPRDDAWYYGEASVTTEQGSNPLVQSDSGYALEAPKPNGNNSNKPVKSVFSNNDPIEINGGTFEGSPSGSDGNPVSVGSGTPNNNNPINQFINKGTFSGPVDDKDLSSDVGAQATVKTSDGQTVKIYGANSQDVSNQVDAYENTLPSDVTVEEVIDAPVAEGGTTPSINETFPNTMTNNKFGIANVELGNEMLQYVNTTNPTNQSSNVGLSIVPNSSPYYFANALDWQLTSLSTSSSSAPVTLSNWTWGPTINGQKSIRTQSNTNWTLYQTYTSTTDSKGNITYTPGQTYLGYNGSGSNPGIYSLTATVQAGAYYQPNTSQQNLPSDSIRLVIGQNLNISNVTITPSTSPTSFNMDTTPSVQFNYTATNTSGQNVQGTIVNWSLSSTGGIKAEEYAYVNPTTGLVTFYQPTPESSYLMLQVTVNGVPSNYVLFAITGTGASTDLTDETLVAWNNPVNIVSGQSYNLASNMYALPGYRSLVQSEDLKFTTDNPNVLIYNNYIFANNSNYTGEVEVTATYTNEDGTTASTTFTVNFVSKAVNPTGVTAQDNLSFVLGDIKTQNVLAKLTPENTTTQTVPGNNSTNGFSYTSSNSSVASVDSFGNVRAVGLGTATITTTYLGDLDNPSTNVKPVYTATTTVTVTETPSDVPATGINYSPEGPIYLAPSTVANAKSSETITASVEPENSTDELNVTISPETVATLTNNEDGTWTVNAVSDGRATVTLQAGNITETINVIVSSQPVVTSGITASGTTPDEFTVTVNNVIPNPALNAANATISNVSIFTWSGPDQVDRQCKAVPTAEAVNGTYSYSPFQVNGNEANTWYFNADSIYVECYAYLSGGNTVYLGGVTPNYSWVDATDTAGHNVAYISYQENIGFVEPTVFDGNQSGLTGRHLQLEGLRVSSCIDGVDVITDVHEQNIGWVEAVKDGNYAGTQHENRQLEAIRLRLTGENASNYDIYYQVHAENLGWTGPVSNGDIAGTVGQNRQIESVQIQIVPKGTTPTGWATN